MLKNSLRRINIIYPISKWGKSYIYALTLDAKKILLYLIMLNQNYLKERLLKKYDKKASIPL